MKVLLIGEYSGVHTNLAKALKEKNIEVLTVHDGDGYKKFPADISIKYNFIESDVKIFKKFLAIYYFLLKFFGILGVIQILKYLKVLKKLKGYDVIQIINPISLSDFGSIVNYLFVKYLVKYNGKFFLCALGDDYFWVSGSMSDKEHYSMLTHIKKEKIKDYIYPLMYRYGFFYKKLNYYVVKHSAKIIPGLQDYYKYYKHLSNCNEIIPIAIKVAQTTEPLKFSGYPIVIFHGWQKNKETRKGNDVFDSVVKSLIQKYPGKIDYKIVSGVPYSEYVKSYNDSIIFLDQCYSMDRGVNALLGMAAGKVVVGGFNNELKERYNIKENEIILDVNYNHEVIFKKLEMIILNPELIEEISKNAINFILEYHNYDVVSQSYVDVWENS